MPTWQQRSMPWFWNAMTDVLQYLRSTLYFVLMILSVIVFASLVVACIPFPISWRFFLAKTWSRLQQMMLRIICGLHYEVEGREQVPERPCVVYWKHTSSWETFFTFIMWIPQCWVAKRELLRIPLFGWALGSLNPIAIDRASGHTAVQQVLDQGKERLEQGIWVNIFPEGTRMPPGTTRRYGLSGALLAERCDVPILPIAHNAGDYWPRHSLLKKPGTITVRIGPPIMTSGRKPEDINREVQDWIETQMQEISPHHAAGRRVVRSPSHLKKKS